MIVIVTGSVCAGKTRVSRRIAKEFGLEYIDIGKLIKNKRVYDCYDKDKRSYVVDVKKLNKILASLIRKYKNLVIDGHLSHYLSNKYVDLCVVVKCELKELKKRLERRGYSKRKVRENLDVEIFDVCLVEALEKGHKVIIVDSTRKIDFSEIRKILKSCK